MSDFFKTYVEESTEEVGIPGFVMNRPVAGANPLKRLGLELEIEGRGLPNEGHLDGIVSKSGATWVTHDDGSLRGEAKEYVLDKPIDITEVPQMVTALYGKFGELDTTLNLSNRCSTHVHYNVGNLRINHLTSIICLWTAFEEILINWCGEERVTNHFCLASKDSNRNIDLWDEFLRTGRRNFGEGAKYTAMHLRSIWNIGSIEFRPMRASETPEDIIDWIKIVNGLCDYARTRYPNPAYIANEVSERRGSDMFLDIAQSSGVSKDFVDSVFAVPDNRMFDDLVLQGLRRVQGLCLGHNWHDWMPLIDKEYVPSPFGEPKKKKSTIGIGGNPIRRPRFNDVEPQAVEDLQWVDAPRPPPAPAEMNNAELQAAVHRAQIEAIINNPRPATARGILNDIAPRVWGVPEWGGAGGNW